MKKKKKAGSQAKAKKTVTKKKAETQKVTKKTAKKVVAKKASKAPAQKASKAVAKKTPANTAVQVEKAKKNDSKAKTKPTPSGLSRKKVSSQVDVSSLNEGQLENYKKWLRYQKQMTDRAPESYKMSSDFEVKTPLQHKTHGWGVVIQKRDNYIDVLFETGLKTLIVNYK